MASNAATASATSCVGLGRDRGLLGVVQQALPLHVARQPQDGVALEPHLDLLARPGSGVASSDVVWSVTR